MDASVELISRITTHPNADKLDLAQILGFQCVVQRNAYKAGDKIIYIRPDAELPLEPWAEEYRNYSPKRIKAVKLRGEWSEGIVVPFSLLPIDLSYLEIGTEVSELIGVIHYEPPVPQELNAKRALPFGIPKTDEERFENIFDKLPFGEQVDVTLKIDGQSWSIYYNIRTKEFGILGRTLEYEHDKENRYSRYIIHKYPDLKERFISLCNRLNVSLCLRGESYGNGIQNFKKNPHSVVSPDIAIFSCYMIDERRYANKGDSFYFLNICKELSLPTVPILESGPLTQEMITKYSTGLDKIDGKPFEGVVIKHSKGSFKVINKTYDSYK